MNKILKELKNFSTSIIDFDSFINKINISIDYASFLISFFKIHNVNFVIKIKKTFADDPSNKDNGMTCKEVRNLINIMNKYRSEDNSFTNLLIPYYTIITRNTNPPYDSYFMTIMPYINNKNILNSLSNKIPKNLKSQNDLKFVSIYSQLNKVDVNLDSTNSNEHHDQTKCENHLKNPEKEYCITYLDKIPIICSLLHKSLYELHSFGFSHNDFKPENLLIKSVFDFKKELSNEKYKFIQNKKEKFNKIMSKFNLERSFTIKPNHVYDYQTIFPLSLILSDFEFSENLENLQLLSDEINISSIVLKKCFNPYSNTDNIYYGTLDHYSPLCTYLTCLDILCNLIDLKDSVKDKLKIITIDKIKELTYNVVDDKKLLIKKIRKFNDNWALYVSFYRIIFHEYPFIIEDFLQEFNNKALSYVSSNLGKLNDNEMVEGLKNLITENIFKNFKFEEPDILSERFDHDFFKYHDFENFKSVKEITVDLFNNNKLKEIFSSFKNLKLICLGANLHDELIRYKKMIHACEQSPNINVAEDDDFSLFLTSDFKKNDTTNFHLSTYSSKFSNEEYSSLENYLKVNSILNNIFN